MIFVEFSNGEDEAYAFAAGPPARPVTQPTNSPIDQMVSESAIIGTARTRRRRLRTAPEQYALGEHRGEQKRQAGQHAALGDGLSQRDATLSRIRCTGRLLRAV